MHSVGRMGKKERRAKSIAAQPEETSLNPSDSAQSTTQKSLEVISWRDANFQMQDEEFDGDYICVTVGWTEEEGQWLKITSEITPNGERAVTRVPLVNVVQRNRIGPSFSTWTTLPEPMESTSSTLPKSSGTQAIHDWC